MKSSNAGTTMTSTSGRRAQPIRQTRTNPPRASATTSRPLAGGRTLGAASVEIGPAATSPPGFFPAIQYFTDAITELPKETIRHLTLFKEVDAKSCGPEERLIQLVEAAINTPVPRKTNPTIQHPPTTATVGNIDHLDENGNLRSATGLAGNDGQVSEPPVPVPYAPTPEETARRQIFEQLHHIASEIMMPTLDEKIHVLSPAREALNKQLTRLDSVFPHVEGEISEEARYGSLTHWAYIEKANVRPNGASDRQRRDVGGANSLAAAAAALNDSEVALRSEMRREAVQARRNRTQHVDSDFDDLRNGRQNSAQPGANKKSHGNTKAKRTTDAPASSTVGLGISNGVSSTSANPPHKRRKTEKTTNNGNGAVAMERSISSAFGGGSGAKGNARSPRETPTAEGLKKRSRAPATGGTRKRNNTTTSTGQSPSIASSPVHGTFGVSKDAFRNSPAPATSQRPTSSRARQNSAQSIAQDVNGRPKASSSTSTKTNGINGVLSNNTTNHATGAATRSPTKPSHHEGLSDDPRKPGDSNKNTPGSDTKTSDGAFKKEENDSVQGIEPTTTTVTTTRTGRTSKTSTPTHPSFPPSFPRSRPSRTDSYTANSATIKRSHKKGAGAAAQAAQAAQLQRITDPNGSHAAGRTGDDSSLQGDQDGDDEGEEDEDEPRYCYCNGVSYGEMVACDNDDCPREWFHLSCVGLKKPPSSSAWYCDDCSKTLKKNGKSAIAVR